MRARLIIPLAIIVVAIPSILAWRTLRSVEPVYHGKPLTAWLYDYHEGGDVEASTAIRQIGTNALPALLQLARTKDSSTRKTLLTLVRRQSKFAFEGDSEAHDLARCGYGVLGPLAKGAVPALTNLLSDPELQLSAIACLGSIGPTAQDAVPALILQINNTNYIVGACAKAALGNINSQPGLVIPALLADLRARNATPHLTILALGRFGNEAKVAVPAILPFLTDGRLLMRTAATNALKQIDAEAAVNAGVK